MGSFPSDEVTQVVLPEKGSQIYSFLALEKLPQRGKNIYFPAPTHTSLHQQHWKYDNVCVNVYFRAQFAQKLWHAQVDVCLLIKL